MRRNLLLKGLTFLLGGFVLMALLLFLPAGTLRYSGAWLLLALLFIPMTALGAVLYLKAPELLRKRLSHRESRGGQKQVIERSKLMFAAAFIVAGLDERFGWTHVPGWLTIAAAAVLLVSYGLYAEVMRENAYLSRIVEVQQNQQVIDTGLYGVVRHPMYMATLTLFLSMPLVLGSWWAFAILLCYPALIVKRLLDEEQLLRAELPGYADYCQRVRWRLIPFVW